MLQSVTATDYSGTGSLGGTYFPTWDWGWVVRNSVAGISAQIPWGASFWITRDADGATQGTANLGGASNPFVLNPQYVAENRSRMLQAEVYPITIREKLPTIKIPLRHKDSDSLLDLQAILDMAYDDGGYDSIDYRGRLDPGLSAEDEKWADKMLKVAKKR